MFINIIYNQSHRMKFNERDKHSKQIMETKKGNP